MKRVFLLAILTIATLSISAQRKTDVLDRGLIAVQTTGGVYCSWRIMGEEYYDVTYNLYRNGVKIADQLKVSNFTDAAGTSDSKYTVKAVVRGIEQAASKEITPWAQNFLEITPKHDGSITSTLVPNDACCADVDGDGELEILMKFDNQNEISASFPKEGNNGEYTICFDVAEKGIRNYCGENTLLTFEMAVDPSSTINTFSENLPIKSSIIREMWFQGYEEIYQGDKKVYECVFHGGLLR